MVFPATPNATGTWFTVEDIAHIFFTPPAGLSATNYTFRLWVSDCLPVVPWTNYGNESTNATVCVNAPPSLSSPNDGSYTWDSTTFTITWTVDDTLLVDSGTFQIYKKADGYSYYALSGSDGYGHDASGTFTKASLPKQISWTCNGDYVLTHTDHTHFQYKLVVNDGYSGTNEDEVDVAAYAKTYVGDWTAQSYNGVAGVSSYYTVASCFGEVWYSWRDQDWWAANSAPRCYKYFDYNTGFWFQTHLNSPTISANQLMGIALYYSPTNVWLWGLYVDGSGTQSIRLQKIVGGTGYDVQSVAVSGVRDFGVEWHGHQARFSYYSSGAWHNLGGWRTLFSGSTYPSYLMTFHKEWTNGDAPNRYCTFDSNYMGIHSGITA